MNHESPALHGIRKHASWPRPGQGSTLAATANQAMAKWRWSENTGTSPGPKAFSCGLRPKPQGRYYTRIHSIGYYDVRTRPPRTKCKSLAALHAHIHNAFHWNPRMGTTTHAIANCNDISPAAVHRPRGKGHWSSLHSTITSTQHYLTWP